VVGIERRQLSWQRGELEFKRLPSDATFQYLFRKDHLQRFGEMPLLQA
jgi:hypothetical protein